MPKPIEMHATALRGRDLLTLPRAQVIGKLVIDSEGRHGYITRVVSKLTEKSKIVASFDYVQQGGKRVSFILANEPITLVTSAPLYGRAWLHLARVTRRMLEKQGCL